MIRNEKINSLQFIFIIVQLQVGVGILTMPYDIYNKAGGDSWLSILLAGLVIQTIFTRFHFLMKAYPTGTFFSIIQKVFGRVIGNVLILIYIMYFIVLAMSLLSRYASILSTWMMPLTPKWILISLMTVIVVYGAMDGLETIGRFLFIASFILIVYVGFSIYALKFMQISYVLPVLNEGFSNMVKGIFPSLYAMQGFEVVLFIYPFLRQKSLNAYSIATISNSIVTLLYTFIVFTTIVFLSPEEIILTPEPVIYLVKSFSFNMIERPDLLFTSIWIVFVATSFVVLLFILTEATHTLFHKQNRKWMTVFFGLLIFLLTLIPYGVYENKNLFAPVNKLIIIFSIIIPLMITGISLMKKRKITHEIH